MAVERFHATPRRDPLRCTFVEDHVVHDVYIYEDHEEWAAWEEFALIGLAEAAEREDLAEGGPVAVHAGGSDLVIPRWFVTEYLPLVPVADVDPADFVPDGGTVLAMFEQEVRDGR